MVDTPVPNAGPREWLALIVLTLAVTLLAIDGTVLALAVPALTAALDPTATQVLWIGDIYSFALAGLLILMGNVADRFGRKRLLLIGTIGFGVASALAAFAPTPEVLIAARALLGISGATLMPSTLSIVRNIFVQPRQRTRAIAVWAAGASGGAALGPLVGGALLEHFWWGSVFLINLPVVVLILALGVWLLPESRNPQRARIDVLSALLSMLALIPAVYAVKHTMEAGVDVASIVAAVVGAVSAVAFVQRQRRLETPLIDVALFRIPAFSGAVLAEGLAIFAFSGLLFFFSVYLQLVRGLSPLEAGLLELPAAIASISIIAVVGFVLTVLGRGRAIGLGLAVAAAGLVMLSFSQQVEGVVFMGAALAVVGLGVGIASTLSTDAVVSAAPPSRAGAASAVAETAYELGVAFGIAVLGSFATLVYRGSLELPAELDPAVAAATRESLPTAVPALDGVPGGAAILEHAQTAFASGMQATALVAAGVLILAAIVASRVIPSGPEGAAEEMEAADDHR